VFEWSVAASDALLSILLAPVCAVCQQLLASPSRACVCDACWASVKRVAPPVCDRCGDALPAASRAMAAIAPSLVLAAPSFALPGALPVALCRRCRRMPRAIDRGRAAGLYEGSLRAIIHAFKYEGRRSLAAPLGALMRRQADGLLDDVAWVVPVPLHWRRARRRGFNQSADLARTLGPPVLHALRRTRATTPQADLPAARRHKNVRDAFALARAPLWRAHAGPTQCDARTLAASSAMASRFRAGGGVDAMRQMLAGRCVLLVDDVTTTGATLEACARVLKEAGVGEVRALTAARVATPPSR
jgi:predicted amidophosphoribosyltransferase